MRVLIAALVVMACSPAAGPTPSASPALSSQIEAALVAPSPSVSAIRPPLGDPAASPDDGSCRTEQELRDRLELFTRAVNDGDRAGIDQALSSVLWVLSVGGGPEPHSAVYGKVEAARDLIRRHAEGERWRLVSIFQPTLRGWDGASHFGVRMERRRGDAVIEHLGKGALFCRGRYEGIEVLNLGSP